MMPRSLKIGLYLAITVPLMGGEFPSCVGSQVPLSDRSEGFIDTALLGTWGQVDEGAILVVALDEEGDLDLMLYEGPFSGEPEHYSAYSSALGGHRYLNATLEECESCEPELLQELRSCPYLIVRYAYDLTGLGMSADTQTEWEQAESENTELFDPNREKVFFQLIKEMDVDAAVERGEIEAHDQLSDLVCMTSSQATLRGFVTRPEQSAFTIGPELDEILVLGFVRLTPSELSFRVEFGTVEKGVGITDHTTTIPLNLCERGTFGFDITPPSPLPYEYQLIHEFPTMPRTVTGEVLDAGPPVRLRGLSNTVEGGKIIAFSFDEGDPTGAYRSELYINGELNMAVDYTVVNTEQSGACEPGR